MTSVLSETHRPLRKSWRVSDQCKGPCYKLKFDLIWLPALVSNNIGLGLLEATLKFFWYNSELPFLKLNKKIIIADYLWRLLTKEMSLEDYIWYIKWSHHFFSSRIRNYLCDFSDKNKRAQLTYNLIILTLLLSPCDPLLYFKFLQLYASIKAKEPFPSSVLAVRETAEL